MRMIQECSVAAFWTLEEDSVAVAFAIALC